MCIVIDTSSFTSVFNTSSKEHHKFRPVLEWIVEGRGKIVYGGTKYKDELKRTPKYIRFFLELDRAGKVVEIDDDSVDLVQEQIKQKISDPNFNDHHIIAIVIESKCKLVCTKDGNSCRFIKERSIYPRHVQCPSIYMGPTNADLLSDKYIADICKPCHRGTKDLKVLFGLA